MSQSTYVSVKAPAGPSGRAVFKLTCLGCGRIRRVRLDGASSRTDSWWRVPCQSGCPAFSLPMLELKVRARRLALWQAAEVAVRRGWPAPLLNLDGSRVTKRPWAWLS